MPVQNQPLVAGGGVGGGMEEERVDVFSEIKPIHWRSGIQPPQSAVRGCAESQPGGRSAGERREAHPLRECVL